MQQKPKYEANKPVYKDSIFSPNAKIATLGFILIFFVGGVIASYISCSIVSSLTKGISYNDLLQFSQNKFEGIVTPQLENASSIMQGWANFTVYFICVLFVPFYLRDDLKKDLDLFKENKKFLLWYTPLCAVLFAILSLLASVLIEQIVEISNNQKTIETVMHFDGKYPMIICTVLFAPIVEELIYRKVIFRLFKDKSIVISYFVSIILFTLPHMLSAPDAKSWLLQVIPYIFSAGLLCAIYHKSKFNIYTCIAAHMLNNIVAVVLVYIGG